MTEHRCDVCGRFIPLLDFEHDANRRTARRVRLDGETWETLCVEHNTPEHRHG